MIYKPNRFILKELVSPITFKAYGEFAWQFFDGECLEELDIIAEEFGRPIIINDWGFGGHYKESGYRGNLDSLVKTKTTPYASSHMFGKGFDLKDKKGKNTELYYLVWGLMRDGKLKYFKRLEHIRHTPTWVHVDGFRTMTGKPEIFTF